ncbi:MAG: hypothetical protein R6X18_05095 [Chloroflexota bacterium]|jgi:hypothetical protein
MIKQRVPGVLIADGELTALMLGHEQSPQSVDLAFALVTQGVESHILPSLLLDDWGNEIKELKLYQWIHENGDRFPRAEVFGMDPAGNAIQYFLRDIDLVARFPVYALLSEDSSGTSALPLRAILLEEAGLVSPQSAEPPPGTSFPLRKGQVEWWKVGGSSKGLDFIQHEPSDS